MINHHLSKEARVQKLDGSIMYMHFLWELILGIPGSTFSPVLSAHFIHLISNNKSPLCCPDIVDDEKTRVILHFPLDTDQPIQCAMITKQQRKRACA